MWRQKFQAQSQETKVYPTQEKQNCCEDLNLKIQAHPPRARARARAPTDRTDSTRRSHVQISYDPKQNYISSCWKLPGLLLPAIIPWQFGLSQATSLEIIHSATATKNLQAKLLVTKTLCLLQPSSSLLNTWDTRRRHMRFHCEVKKKPCATSHPKTNSLNTKTPKFSLL
jgi:hypothetical protein